MMKIQLQGLKASKMQQGVPAPRRPAWYKATQDDKTCYTEVLNLKLSELAPPASLHCRDVNCEEAQHSRERDSHVIDIMCAVMEASHECIPLSAPPKSQTKKGNNNMFLPSAI